MDSSEAPLSPSVSGEISPVASTGLRSTTTRGSQSNTAVIVGVAIGGALLVLIVVTTLVLRGGGRYPRTTNNPGYLPQVDVSDGTSSLGPENILNTSTEEAVYTGPWTIRDLKGNHSDSSEFPPYFYYSSSQEVSQPVPRPEGRTYQMPHNVDPPTALSLRVATFGEGRVSPNEDRHSSYHHQRMVKRHELDFGQFICFAHR